MIFSNESYDLVPPNATGQAFSGNAEQHFPFISTAYENRSLKSNGVNGWEIGEYLQNGSFFCVAQARPTSQNGQFLYAIKRLRDKWRQTEIGLAILQREAEVGRLISHPHLVPVLDADFDPHDAFLVQPWLTGQSLYKILSSGRTARPIETLWVGRQIADALAALESHGYCHCDVKPGNVMLSPTGHATLIDLGLARKTGETSLPLECAVGGTPKYMAPERFDASKSNDIRADQYSLGLIMLEMLFGQGSLVSDEPANRVLAGRWHEYWQPLDRRFNGSQTSRAWLAEFQKLLRSMIETDANKRPRSAELLKRQMIQLELAAI